MTTLSTRGTPRPIKNLEEFISRALSFDFYTDMSDDPRVWRQGQGARAQMAAFAAGNPVAQDLWDRVQAHNASGYMYGQLMTQVSRLALSEDQDPAALIEFALGYLATVGRDTEPGRILRDDIGRAIKAPWKWKDKEGHKAAIDAWLEERKQ